MKNFSGIEIQYIPIETQTPKTEQQKQKSQKRKAVSWRNFYTEETWSGRGSTTTKFPVSGC